MAINTRRVLLSSLFGLLLPLTVPGSAALAVEPINGGIPAANDPVPTRSTVTQSRSTPIQAQRERTVNSLQQQQNRFSDRLDQQRQQREQHQREVEQLNRHNPYVR